MKNISIVNIFLILYVSPYLYSQTSFQPKFVHLGTQDGLSHSNCNAIVQDKIGFLWFGTEDGLNRYDGYSFNIYWPEPGDPKAISSKFILDLKADSFGYIWIKHRGTGVSVFDVTTERFINYVHEPGNHYSLSNNNVNEILVSRQNEILIATDNGLCIFDRDLNGFKRLLYNVNKPVKVQCLAISKQGDIWAGTNDGLYCISRSGSVKYHYTANSQSPNTLPGNKITALFCDKDNWIWVACNRLGLSLLKPEKISKGYFEKIDIRSPVKGFNRETEAYCFYQSRNGTIWIGNTTGVCAITKTGNWELQKRFYLEYPSLANYEGQLIMVQLYEDSKGNIWALSRNPKFGIAVLRKNKSDFERYTHDVFVPDSPTANASNAIYEDNSGVIWLAHVKGGLSKVDLHSKPFISYNHLPNVDNSLPSNDVYSVVQDSSGRIWVGTLRGLSCITRQFDGQFVSKTYSKISLNTTYSIPGALLVDPLQRLWIGFYDGQLCMRNIRSGIETSYNYDYTSATTIACWAIRALMWDNGALWIASGSGGLTLLDKNLRDFYYYFPSPSPWKNIIPRRTNGEILSQFTSCLLKDNQNRIWVGTVNRGLSCFNPITKVVKNYSVDANNPQSINCDEIYSLHQSNDTTIWVGTGGGGLNCFNTRKETFSHYTIRQGLAGNTVYGILEDSKNNLWLSTNTGLSRFSPITGRCRNYYKDDGLPGNEFYQGAYYKNNSTGEMFFGGINGLVSFYPDSINDEVVSVKPVITTLRVFSRLVLPGDSVLGVRVLDTSISITSHIKLPYYLSDLSFGFTGLHFAAPAAIKYRYILEGFDNDWKITTASNRLAVYTRIPPGNYKFVVEASLDDTNWSKVQASLLISILPPWWKTWWFRVLAWTLMIAIVSFTYYLRVINLKRRNRILEEKISKRTFALLEAKKDLEIKNHLLQEQKEESMAMAEQLHQADERRIQLYTNISHEFRTPLTLLQAPLEKISNSPPNTPLTNVLPLVALMKRNLNHLIKLVGQIIDIRKLDSNEVRLHPEQRDIVEFISGLVSEFSADAERHQVTIKVNALQPVLNVWFDADIVEKIVFNLVGNALKYTPDGGEVICHLDVTGRLLTISISDTGVGINPEDIPHLFEPFFQARNKNTARYKGSGIGLSYSLELARLHGGTIEVVSGLGKGSVFVVKLALLDEPESIIDRTHENAHGPAPIIEQPNNYIQKTSGVKHSVPEKNEKITVLIVEDHPELRQFLSDELSGYYTVIAATEGSQALELASEFMPHLIISDVMMPGMDGLEFCRRIKTNTLTCHIPVILLTALSSETNQLAGFETGADDYITKPFNSNILLLKISNLLANRQRLRELFNREALVKPSDIVVTSLDKVFLEKAISIVEKNIADNSFSVEDFCREMGMSKPVLNKKLVALTNLVPSKFINNLRLKRAALLIKQNAGTINEIMYDTGFTNSSYFARLFKETFGVNPSEFK